MTLTEERDALAKTLEETLEAIEIKVNALIKDRDTLASAAKLALEALEMALACDPKICKCSGQRAIAALRLAGMK